MSGFIVESKFKTNFDNGNPLALCLSDMICAVVTYLTGLSSIDYCKKVDLATEGDKPYDCYEVKRSKLVKSVNYYKRATSNLKRLMSTKKPYLLSIIWNSVQIVQLLLLTSDYEFNIGKSGRAIITLSKATKICQLKGYDVLDASNSFGISDIMIDAWAGENELFDIDLLLKDHKRKYELSKAYEQSKDSNNNKTTKVDENSQIRNEFEKRLNLKDELETSANRQDTKNDDNMNTEYYEHDDETSDCGKYFTSSFKTDLKSKLIATTNNNISFLDNIVRTGSIEEACGSNMIKSSSVSEHSVNDGTNDTSANNSIADSNTPIFLNNDIIEDSLSLALIRENEGYDELFVKEERRRAFWRLYTLNKYVTIGTEEF
ncbi:unnamed protein product [[Candida] boidinii]|nr:unnamed protein product [[Candida] boidinii]